MRELIYTKPAQADLRIIFRFLSAEIDKAVAADQLDKVRTKANGLADFPHLGPAVEGRPFRTLRVRGTPFTLVYSVSPDEIKILRVVHGAQDRHESLA